MVLPIAFTLKVWLNETPADVIVWVVLRPHKWKVTTPDIVITELSVIFPKNVGLTEGTENVSVFALLDKLKGLTEVQLTQVIAQVLNSYREKTSQLGFRIQPKIDTFESRNILV